MKKYLHIPPNAGIWFTDGLKQSPGTGAENLGRQPNKYYEPIFQAEIHPIEKCLQIIMDKGQVRQDIAILFDRQQWGP